MSRKKRGKTTPKPADNRNSAETIEGRVIYGPGYEDQTEERAGTETVTASDQAGASGTGDMGQETIATAADTAQETTSSVAETAGDVVSSATATVQQAATAVVDTTQQATSAVTDAVTDKVGLVSGAAANQVERLADTIAQAASSGDAPRVQRQVAETTANVLDQTAEYLRTGDTGAILKDLRNGISRHPLRSLAIGLGLGYLARSVLFPGSGGQQASRPRDVPRSAPLAGAVPVYGGDSLSGYETVDTGFTTTGYDAVYTSGSSVDTSMAVTGTAGDVLGGSTLDATGGTGIPGAGEDFRNLPDGAADTTLRNDSATTLDTTNGGDLGRGPSGIDADLPDDRLGRTPGLDTDLTGSTPGSSTGALPGDITTTGDQFGTTRSDDPLRS
jgi:hypothetical protein